MVHRAQRRPAGRHCAPGVFWYLTKGSRLWKFLGVLAVLGPSSVAFYYMVVEAWCFGYFWKMLTQPELFVTAESTAQTFFSFTGMAGDGSALLSDNGMLWIVGGVILINLGIIYRGISKGIEMFSRWFMPVLLLVSVILLVRILCIGTPDPNYPDRSIEQGLGYMWNPSKVLVEEKTPESGEWKTVSMVSASRPGAMEEAGRQVEMSNGTLRLTKVTLWDGLRNIELWVAAAGQVFLSLSVGTGLILTYASYVRKKEDIALSALSASASNEVCEVGLARHDDRAGGRGVSGSGRGGRAGHLCAGVHGSSPGFCQDGVKRGIRQPVFPAAFRGGGDQLHFHDAGGAGVY